MCVCVFTCKKYMCVSVFNCKKYMCVCVFNCKKYMCVCVYSIVRNICVCVYSIVRNICVCVYSIVRNICVCVYSIVRNICVCVYSIAHSLYYVNLGFTYTLHTRRIDYQTEKNITQWLYKLRLDAAHGNAALHFDRRLVDKCQVNIWLSCRQSTISSGLLIGLLFESSS